MEQRVIEQEMIDFIDIKLATNGLAQEIMRKRDKLKARTLLVLVAQCMVGIREVGGNNTGPLVRLIQETVGRSNREAWCMAFVQTCIAYVEVKLDIKSPLIATEHCTTLWNATPATLRVKRVPAPGAIPIYNYPPSSNGHTGIFYRRNRLSDWNIEGNTESGLVGGVIERDGGGVYDTRRAANMPKSGAKMVLRGYLIPFPGAA
jgi:hypothetical protein